LSLPLRGGGVVGVIVTVWEGFGNFYIRFLARASVALELFSAARPILSVLADQSAVGVLALLYVRPMLPAELSGRLGLSKWAVYKALRALEGARLVSPGVRGSRGVEYHLTGSGRLLVAGLENLLKGLYGQGGGALIVEKDDLSRLVEYSRGYLKLAYLRGHLAAKELEAAKAWLSSFSTTLGGG
jgi:DNA-binding MarR family transcriptional regulator